MPIYPHPFPALYFNSGVKFFDQTDNGAFVKNDYLSGAIKGETGIEGLKLDFNAGLRLEVPGGNWHVKITDADSELVFFDYDIAEKTLLSMEQFFIRWQVEVSRNGERVFVHTFDATEQEVCFVLQDNVVGDNIMFLPYIVQFAQEHKCRPQIIAGGAMQKLIGALYPHLTQARNLSEETYATYDLRNFQKSPFFESDNSRTLPFDYIGRFLLGLTRTPPLPEYVPIAPRPVQENYVCIAVQASGVQKSWLYPGGWDTVVEYLQKLGYRVICIDRDPVREDEAGRVVIPPAAEDMTGNFDLTERLDMLCHAAFFVGLSSGITWLARLARIPVVIISGQTMPYTEFDTPYRVINRLVCHGCYNDVRVDWRHCPYHKGTKRAVECSRKIHPQQVIAAIDRLRTDHGLP